LPHSMNFDLVFAMQQLIFDDVPWVVDFEFVNALVGYGNIRTCKKEVEKTLRSQFCKKILPWSDWSKKTMECSLDCKYLEEKIEKVNLAVKRKSLPQKKDTGRVRLLFVGSTNPPNSHNFELKGGIEAIEAFVKLSERYDCLDLVVRSWVPKEILSRYSQIANLRFCCTPLSSSALADLYASSDIFLFPSHTNLGMAILEAMSYELPVVSLDVYDIPEAVQDMKTGLLLEPSKDVPYYTWNGSPNHFDKRFWSAIGRSKSSLVSKLVEAVSLLIENDSLRRNMGVEGKRQVEDGVFSLEHRNRKIRKIFEESLKK